MKISVSIWLIFFSVSHFMSIKYRFCCDTSFSVSTTTSHTFIAFWWLQILSLSLSWQLHSVDSLDRLSCTISHHSSACFYCPHFSSILSASSRGTLFSWPECWLLIFLESIISYTELLMFFLFKAICSNFWLNFRIHEQIPHVYFLIILRLFISDWEVWSGSHF